MHDNDMPSTRCARVTRRGYWWGAYWEDGKWMWERVVTPHWFIPLDLARNAGRLLEAVKRVDAARRKITDLLKNRVSSGMLDLTVSCIMETVYGSDKPQNDTEAYNAP